MSSMTVLCSATAGACLMLSVVHVVIWLRNRAAVAHLGFSVLAAGVAWFTWAELSVMRALTPADIGRALQWTHASILAIVAGMVVFMHYFFGTGRGWLGHAAWSMRLVILVVSATRPESADYDAITAVTRVPFLGDVVSVAVGRTSVWHWIAQVGFALLVAFVADASIALWRRGRAVDRQRALAVGGTTAIFAVGGPLWAALIFADVVRWPHIEFVFFVPAVLAMAYELGQDVLSAAQLASRLQVSEAALRESEHRMRLAAEAARLGMWIRDLTGDRIWLSATCRELFGFPAHGEIADAAFAGRVHPDDRATRDAAIDTAIGGQAPYRLEYRVLLPDGTERWIASLGDVESDPSGRVVRLLGVCLDTTEQRKAEHAARELSGRLINAQEDERRRIARDLHDDLSQRLALLSVEVNLLDRARLADERDAQVGHIAAAIRDIATEVHRLAYQLHPAKLDQLGLVPAARSWCRDLERQSGMSIAFVPDRVPAELPDDVALCLFRILQESLQNVVRHSGSRTAIVRLSSEPSRLRLLVTDTGRGFARGADSQRGLGLVSMQERVRLVNGAMVIRSQPGSGTELEVTVPLAAGVPAPESPSVR